MIAVTIDPAIAAIAPVRISFIFPERGFQHLPVVYFCLLIIPMSRHCFKPGCRNYDLVKEIPVIAMAQSTLSLPVKGYPGIIQLRPCYLLFITCCRQHFLYTRAYGIIIQIAHKQNTGIRISDQQLICSLPYDCSRRCPLGCTPCFSAASGRPVRYHDINSIAKQYAFYQRMSLVFPPPAN